MSEGGQYSETQDFNVVAKLASLSTSVLSKLIFVSIQAVIVELRLSRKESHFVHTKFW